MTIPEARIEETSGGQGSPFGTGWFVLSLIGARGFATEGQASSARSSRPTPTSRTSASTCTCSQPGERSALYHSENVQEGFLVLTGECLAVVEEQERVLRAWDYLHCPAGTGARADRRRRRPVRDPDGRGAQARHDDRLPVSEAAARHGLSTPVASDFGARGIRQRRLEL